MPIDPLSAGVFGVSVLASLFGGNEQEAEQVFNRLSPDQQKALNDHAQGITTARGVPLRQTQYQQVGQYNPADPFSSQQRSALGQQPVGYFDELHQYERDALRSLGEDDDSEAALARFRNPFFDQVTQKGIDAINKQSDLRGGQLRARNGMINSRGRSDTLGNLDNQNEEVRNNAIGNLSAQYGLLGHDYARKARDEFNQRRLASGGAIRGFNDRALGFSNPSAQFGLNQQLNFEKEVSPLLAAFQSGYETRPGEQSPSDISRLGGIGLAASTPNANGHSVFNNIFGQGGSQQTYSYQPTLQSTSAAPRPNFNLGQNPNFNYNPQFGR